MSIHRQTIYMLVIEAVRDLLGDLHLHTSIRTLTKSVELYNILSSCCFNSSNPGTCSDITLIKYQHLSNIAYMLTQYLSCTELVQFDLGSSVHYSTTANGILPVVGAGVGRVSSEVLTPLIDFSNSEIVDSKLVTCKTEFQSLLTKNHPTIL